mmetsp:Transcript_24611/g.58759  ORF Transcript_24611/g.58759 Transcript_24611/m.58759 type:complete len:275 (+) Transcript_24611:417-1241(+)
MNLGLESHSPMPFHSAHLALRSAHAAGSAPDAAFFFAAASRSASEALNASAAAFRFAASSSSALAASAAAFIFAAASASALAASAAAFLFASASALTASAAALLFFAAAALASALAALSAVAFSLAAAASAASLALIASAATRRSSIFACAWLASLTFAASGLSLKREEPAKTRGSAPGGGLQSNAAAYPGSRLQLSLHSVCMKCQFFEHSPSFAHDRQSVLLSMQIAWLGAIPTIASTLRTSAASSALVVFCARIRSSSFILSLRMRSAYGDS